MITLRPFPPAAFDHPDPLLNAYYGGLLAQWPRIECTTATLISNMLTAGSVSQTCKTLGIEAGEWALIYNRIDPKHYVTMRARKGIHRLLNPGAFPIHTSILKDKRRFRDFGNSHALPIPDTCFCAKSAARWIARQDRFLIKPNFSSKGKGITLFAQDGCGWRDNNGVYRAQKTMLEHLRRMLAKGMLAQAAVPTLPELCKISVDALPTLRIVTILNGRGEAEISSQVLRLGGGAAPVDNFNRGGIASAISIEGKLGTKIQATGGSLVNISFHPANGSHFPTNLPAPVMAAACSLARRSHQALGRGYTAVGWDVGLGADGPVLIEGNWNPGTDVMQLIDGNPLSAQPAGALYLDALSRVPEHRWMAARALHWDGR